MRNRVREAMRVRISLGFMAPSFLSRIAWSVLVLCLAGTLAGCGPLAGREYEYEEEIYLSLDGSADVTLWASTPALVALRGFDLPLDPDAEIDLDQVRRDFEAPGVEVDAVRTSVRDGRLFIGVTLEVDDVNRLAGAQAFSWSSYRFGPMDDLFRFEQHVGPAAGREVGNVGWTGEELVAFRMHLPSRIPFHNAPSREIERGNILSWEQPLRARLSGEPVAIDVRLEADSILYSTLLLFGASILAAALAFGLVLLWIMRKGRHVETAPRA